MDTKVNYAGITKRIIAYLIDNIIMLLSMPTLFLSLMMIFSTAFENNELGKDSFEMATNFLESNASFIVYTLSTTFEVLMLIRFSGTTGHLLCGIRIKDAKTFKKITIIQAAIRCIFIVIIPEIILLSAGYTVLVLVIMLAIVLAIVLAVFDKRKQFFHDKITRTVAIDYKASS